MPGPTVLAQGGPWIRWGWVSKHTDLIFTALREHVLLTVAAVGLGLLIAAPLALLARRRRRLLALLLYVTGFLYTIPSLALFAGLVYWTGLSRTTALIPLTIYTLLILIRNIVAGLEGVPADVREAAEGMGYGPGRLLIRVEIPLAMPVIIGGIRIAVVTTIGLVTVTAVIGQNSLGLLILNGMTQNFFKTEILVGTVLSVALSVVADLSLVGVQWFAMPWSRRSPASAT